MTVHTIVESEVQGITCLLSLCDKGRPEQHWRVEARDERNEYREGCVIKGRIGLVCQRYNTADEAWSAYFGVLRTVAHVGAR